MLFALGALLASPLLLLSWIERLMSKSELVFSTCVQFISLLPGPFGIFVRSGFYVGALEQCSWEVHIGFGSLIVHRGAVIRTGVSTGSYCVLGHVDIGRNSRLASHVSIPSGKRQHLGESGELIDATHYDQVSIGPDCWLGEGTIVMADIGEASIVCAGAVVVSEMPGRSVIGGNPARILKELAPGGQPGTD